MRTDSTTAPSTPSFIEAFITSESAAGLLLMAVAALALAIANSFAAPFYFGALGARVAGLSVLHWINDALMAVFFLLVGLEIKREALVGELSTWSQRALPGVAALGGMLVPALVYLAANSGDGGAPRGWAIPAATDIAFALGVMSLLGPRVPTSLKVLLTALAVIDDLGAVVIIALFYTNEMNWPALGAAAVVTAVLVGMNLRGVTRLLPYLLCGLVLWFLVLQSGVHATLAGVVLAMTIPLRTGDRTPLATLEHAIHPWVGFVIVPLFGLANAGVSFSAMSLADVANPVPLGVALGLFVGKQTGVFCFSLFAIRLGFAKLPEGAGWMHLYGVSLLCGIGFTMSLFIGLLAFDGNPALQDETKLGVILGSVLSAIFGAFLLGRLARSGPVPTLAVTR